MAIEDSSNTGAGVAVSKEQVSKFPIVGVGASAGGLEALKELLQELPADLDMAFVLIPHLNPEHRSLMAEILARVTSMPVIEVKDEPLIERNHVYVIPPNRTMLLSDGHLKLVPREAVRGQHRSIDAFLQSLAENQAHQAIGIILSGTGTDGTLGVEAIKAEGGITFAQDDSAQQDSMPRSAISAGCIDYVLAPEAIAAELTRIARHPYISTEDRLARESESREQALAEGELNKILHLLHDASGVDYSGYKSTTLFRRITRRMLLHGIEGIGDYFRLLQADAGELQNLGRDVLISVTAFFRDPGCYETINRRILPEVLRNRTRKDTVRVWVLGCASGEEAYSLAITICEFITDQGIDVPVQIFATDLNERGLIKARIGLYSKNIAEDVSPERLRRFFVETEDGYQVVKQIREMCVFARQNVLADPPFSHLDLVSCRNLLIYLEPMLQKRLITMLHYALSPRGFLWLGGSENINGLGELFETIEPKQKIFKRKPGPSATSVNLLAPSWETREFARGRPRPAELNALDLQREADRLAVAKYVPPAVLLNAEYDVQQFRGDTRPFLAQAPGKPTTNVLKMAREGLLVPLRSALEKARMEGKSVRQEGVRIKLDSSMRNLNLEVLPLGNSSAESGFLVLFEDPELQNISGSKASIAAVETDDELGRLAQELAATREYLQSLIEQQEAYNEELQSANEEIQSSNEELQSVNEELQTSKEEVQSSNEELTTVNEELRNRNDLLDRAHNDLNNFIASSQLAMVMIGTDSRVRRFSPSAEKLLNLIGADIGRSIGQLRLPLDLQDLEALLSETINHVTPIEREVQDRQGHWFSLRIRPYRTSENRIDGAVIILVDIDAQKYAQEEIRVSEEKYRLLVEGAVGVAIMLLDTEGKVATWNVGAERIFGYAAVEIVSQDFSRFFVPEDVASDIPRRELEQARTAAGSAAGTDDILLLRRDGTRFWASGVTTALRDDGGTLRGFSKVVRDITDKKLNEEALHEEDRRKDEFLATLAHELRNPLAPLTNALEVLQLSNRDPVTIDRSLGVMGRQVEKLKRLIADILDVSRISNRRIELRREKVDLRSIIEHALESEQHTITTARHDLSMSLPSEPVWMDGDPVRLEQIFANLFHNAANYTDPGGQITLTLEIDDHRNGPTPRQAIVKIRDTGVGIPSEQLTKIFQLFARADTSYTRPTEGLGIGLSLVKSLVELHGGTVRADSEGMGKGSIFSVWLPLRSEAMASNENSAERPRRSAREKPNFTARSILVVDDNMDAADSLSYLLRSFGHDVQVALNGPDALEATVMFLPDVVFLDIGMPGMDGYEVARRLRRRAGLENTILVALTGYGSDTDRRHSFEAGFDVHLVKPIDAVTLTSILDTIENGR